MEQERRKHERLSLEAIEVFTLQSEQGGAMLCTVQNINEAGMMVEFVTQPEPGLETGRMLRFIQTPSVVADLLADIQARVVWTEDNYAGLEFEKPLDKNTDDLKDFFESKRLIAWNTWAQD